MAELCSVCKVTSSKYKCPKCTVRYCSVLCCTNHKAESKLCIPEPRCSTSNNIVPVIDDNASEVVEAVLASKEPLRLLTESEKRILRNSASIKNLLGSKRLQADILSIEQAPNRLQSLKKKRKNPEFDQFVTALLNVLHNNNENKPL